MLGLASPENPLPCASCLCFPCSAPLKIAQFPRYAPWTLGNTTGQEEWPPAKGDDHRLLVKPSATDGWPVSTADGRPAKASCRILFWQQQRAKQGIVMHFKQMCAPTHPLSCLWLKGTWFSILGPPIAHFNAWWPKKPSMHFDMECNAHKHTRRPNLYHTHFKRSSMHAYAMQS